LGGGAADPTTVYFEAGATAGFDPAFDAAKLPNSSGLNLASFDDGGQPLAINGLPPSLLGSPLTVGLFVGGPAYGTYNLQVSQLTAFAATAVYLTDAEQQTTTRLALGTSYAFELTAANTGGTYATGTRFALQFAPGAPLPVVLTDFTAQAQAGGVRLAWATASEVNSAYFAVERSPDGRAFAELGRVAAAGTSIATHRYAYLDASAPAGVVYYRLRQVDLDGPAHYSPVRAVTWAGGAAGLALYLYPNPARPQATLAGAGPGAEVQVRDARGRLVLRTTADTMGAASLALPAGWPPGVYVVRAGGQALRLVVE
jgi:hypothetical protein